MSEYNKIKRERGFPKKIVISRRVLERIHWLILRIIPISDELKTPYLDILDKIANKMNIMLDFVLGDDELLDAYFEKTLFGKRGDDNTFWRPKREFYTFNQLLSIYLNKKEEDNILNRLNNLNNIFWYPKRDKYSYSQINEILINLKRKEMKKRTL